ncbi:MAG: HAD family hydrolase [Myxococcota bacterium]
MTPYVLLDRDGTLVHDEGYTHRVADYALLDGVVEGLRALAAGGFRFAIVTNQSGIGRGYYSEDEFARFQSHLVADLARQGVAIDATFHCPHAPSAACACRKPAAGLMDRIRAALDIDVAHSWMVGDSERDVGFARNARLAGAVLLRADASAAPRVARDLREAARHILSATRAAAVAGRDAPTAD